MELEVAVEQSDAALIVRVAGEIDLASAPTLKDALARADGKSSPVVVDMTDVTFLDSSGLSVLVTSWKEMSSEDAPGDLRLVVTRPAIQRVLDVTGLDQVFKVFDTLDAALSI